MKSPRPFKRRDADYLIKLTDRAVRMTRGRCVQVAGNNIFYSGKRNGPRVVELAAETDCKRLEDTPLGGRLDASDLFAYYTTSQSLKEGFADYERVFRNVSRHYAHHAQGDASSRMILSDASRTLRSEELPIVFAGESGLKGFNHRIMAKIVAVGLLGERRAVMYLCRAELAETVRKQKQDYSDKREQDYVMRQQEYMVMRYLEFPELRQPADSVYKVLAENIADNLAALEPSARRLQLEEPQVKLLEAVRDHRLAKVKARKHLIPA